MKAWIAIFSLSLNPFSVFAVEPSGLKNEIKQNWSYTELLTLKDGNSSVSKKSFIRYLNIGRLEIPIAQTHYVLIKNPKEKTNLSELSKIIASSFNTLKIKASTNEKSASIEGDWDKVNRHVKIQLILKEKKIMS